MARERRRLWIDPVRLRAAAATAPATLQPAAAEAHYLQRVLRCRPGDRLDLVDGAGRLLPAVLEAGGALRLELEQEPPPQPPARLPITLALALPRRDGELVWRMATELGVDRLQPLLAERGQVRGEAPLERWRAIVREALEQCERLWLPQLEEPQPALAWLQQHRDRAALLATTRREGLPPLEHLLPAAAMAPGATAALEEGVGAGGDPLPPVGPASLAGVTLAVGPEGGWSPAEETAALEAGWRPVSLGPTILRTGTAAVAGVARLVSWRTLSCAASNPPSRGNPPDRLPPGDDAADPPRG
ncbi:MAG: RsmE family RNA methyltransferase [Synechococcaceae cyanobacterium]|nr:RsmE family RNA methyltransferase [Synechococcaceae cyanobacterium]